MHPASLQIGPRSVGDGYPCFVLAEVASAHEGDVEWEQLSLVLGPDFVLTFQEKPGGDYFDPVRQRLRDDKGRIRRMGADYLLFPSDYPHERQRAEFMRDIPAFVERTDLTDAVKEQILYHNPRRFYRLD